MQLPLNLMQLPANAPEANREDHHCDNQYWIDTQCYGLPPLKDERRQRRISQGCKYINTLGRLHRLAAKLRGARCCFFDQQHTLNPLISWPVEDDPLLGKVRHGNHQNP